MIQVAVLVSDNMLPGHPEERADAFERDEQLSKLRPAFRAADMSVELVRWRETAALAERFDVVLPLFVWDYFEGNQSEFLRQVTEASRQTHVLNDVATLRWNSDKRYLNDLASRGAAVIPTIITDSVSESDVRAACREFGTEQLVIKPLVGGGAWRQVLLHQSAPLPAPDLLPPGEAMLQPYLSSVTRAGEISLIFFDGKFSHGVRKRPKDGDYRIQSIYGGKEERCIPSRSELETAVAVLNVLDSTPLYARVDLLTGADGGLVLIELELIEPYLYMNHSEGIGGDNKAARMLTAALAERMRM